MSRPSISRAALTALLATAALATSTVMPAHAAWEDRSDELPGMTSGSKMLLVGLGVAAVATTVFLIARSGGDAPSTGTLDAADETAPAEEASPAGEASTSTSPRIELPSLALGVGMLDDGVAVGFTATF